MNKLTYYGATTLTLLSIGLLSNGYHADAKQQTSVKVYHFNKSHHQYKLSNTKNIKYSGKASLGKSIKYNGNNYYYLSKVKGYISLNDFNKINDHYAKQQKQRGTKTATDALAYPKSAATSTATSTAISEAASTPAPTEYNNVSTINNNSASNSIDNSKYNSSAGIGYDYTNSQITNLNDYYKTFQKTALDRINQYRSFKGLSPLNLDPSLEQIAYLRANYVARTDDTDEDPDHEDSNFNQLAVRLGLNYEYVNSRMSEKSISNSISEITDPYTLGKKIVDNNFSFADDELMYDSKDSKVGIGVSFNYILNPEDGNGIVFIFGE